MPRAFAAAPRVAEDQPSSSEFEASRLAPCSPVHATSPIANSPGIVVASAIVGHDAAALVVRGGDDRDRLGRHVDAELPAGRVDVGEALHQERPRAVGHVQQHAVIAGALDLGVDRAGHHVAGRQRSSSGGSAP